MAWKDVKFVGHSKIQTDGKKFRVIRPWEDVARTDTLDQAIAVARKSIGGDLAEGVTGPTLAQVRDRVIALSPTMPTRMALVKQLEKEFPGIEQSLLNTALKKEGVKMNVKKIVREELINYRFEKLVEAESGSRIEDPFPKGYNRGTKGYTLPKERKPTDTSDIPSWHDTDQERTEGTLREAKDETNVQTAKPKPRSWNASLESWEWRIHSKGSYWQVGGLRQVDKFKSRDVEQEWSTQWGARAKTGEVDHFPSQQKAMRFADWANPDERPGSYVRGKFETTGEEKQMGKNLDRLREVIRKELTEILREQGLKNLGAKKAKPFDGPGGDSRDDRGRKKWDARDGDLSDGVQRESRGDRMGMARAFRAPGTSPRKRIQRPTSPVKVPAYPKTKKEVAPPGWEKTVKKMKKHKDDIENPFALAWHLKKKGATPSK